MFDTINGLPVHPLVVHAVVVLLPLMAIVSVLVAAVPKWRKAAKWVVLANALVFVASFAAKESGEQLQERLGGQIAHEHGEYGNLVPVFALFLLLASAVVWFATTRPGVLMPISIGLVSIAALSAIGWTVITGDTGAQATWKEQIAGTTAPKGDGG